MGHVISIGLDICARSMVVAASNPIAGKIAMKKFVGSRQKLPSGCFFSSLLKRSMSRESPTSISRNPPRVWRRLRRRRGFAHAEVGQVQARQERQDGYRDGRAPA